MRGPGHDPESSKRDEDRRPAGNAAGPGAGSPTNSASFEELRESMRAVDPSLTDDEIRAFFFQEENGRLVPNLARVVEYVQTHGAKEPSGSKSSQPSPELRRFLTLTFGADPDVSPEEAESRADQVFELIEESIDVDEILKQMQTPTHVESTVEQQF